MASYNGKLLHIDLTKQRTWVEEISDYLYRRYLGGSALASHFLLRELNLGIDPHKSDQVVRGSVVLPAGEVHLKRKETCVGNRRDC